MRDAETPSNLFVLATRNVEGSKYEKREVNMAFEKRHVSLFSIVPPTVGSIIELEASFTIDVIRYCMDGKIALYCTLRL